MNHQTELASKTLRDSLQETLIDHLKARAAESAVSGKDTTHFKEAYNTINSLFSDLDKLFKTEVKKEIINQAK